MLYILNTPEQNLKIGVFVKFHQAEPEDLTGCP